MTDLIKISERDDQQVVSARELYNFLGATERFQSWFDRHLQFGFIADVDFTSVKNFAVVHNGAQKEISDYAISIDMAKELSMLQRSDKGKQARQYFIACEKKLKEQSKNQLPQTFAQALALAAEQALKLEEQQKAIEVMKPKEEFFDAVAGSKDAISMNEVAKVLDIKGMGRNKMFEFLREKKVLMNNNTPYQKYVDCGYFRIVEQKYMKDNEQCISIKTLVYQKGIDFIRRLVLKK